MIDPSEVAEALRPYVRIHRAFPNRLSVYCPYHKGGAERHPSMSVYLESGRVICFTCGHRAWLDRFLVDLGMDRDTARAWRERLAELRAAAGPPTEAEELERRATDLVSWVGSFQAYLPRNLLEAGFAAETLDTFRVGYDVRHQRVTYPVYDRHGCLVAVVGGAVYPGTFPKYKLYDEEVGIDKDVRQNHRDHLWGFDLVPEGTPYVVVEGYKAAMWVHQMGFPACATQGTSFTETQVELMAEAFQPVTILFDNDPPGRAASERLYFKLLQRMGHVRWARYLSEDPNLQPDGLTREQLQKVLQREGVGNEQRLP